MKRLLLLLLPLLVSGCGYGSMFEADEACRAWKYKGGYIKQAIDTDDEPYWAIIRSCDDDVTTRQVLGYDIPGVQVGTTYIGNGTWIDTTYTNENGHVLGRQVITKWFKY